MKNYFLIIFIFFLFTCSENTDKLSGDNDEKTEQFEVEVIGPDLDCGLWLIEFRDIDLSRLKKITETYNSSIFEAHNLDQEFKQQNIELLVYVRKTRDNELTPCTALGPSYPWITIVEAHIIE
jgi:hypothetical protein